MVKEPHLASPASARRLSRGESGTRGQRVGNRASVGNAGLGQCSGVTPERSRRVTSCAEVKTFYDDPIGAVRYRLDKRPIDRSQASELDGWKAAWNGITGLRLRVRDEAIEVRGFGPLRRFVEVVGRANLSLLPGVTTMWTVPLPRWSRNAGRKRWGPQADHVALTCKLSEGAEYTLAILPSDRDLDRLKTALRMAGVREA
jgi:hypothetical protein